MSFWHKFDKILTKAEKKGFETANKAHIWTVNILVCGTLYGIYTLFRDYNEFFIDARVKNLIIIIIINNNLTFINI